MATSNPLEGRVEVCYDRVWGTVCHNNWNALDASVVCFQLGYSASGKMMLSEEHNYSIIVVPSFYSACKLGRGDILNTLSSPVLFFPPRFR